MGSGLVCHVKKFSCTRGEIYRFFVWTRIVDLNGSGKILTSSADDLLSGNCRGKKIKEAKEFLLEILADGAVEQNVIVKEVRKPWHAPVYYRQEKG